MKKILLTAVVMLASVASYAQQAVGAFHIAAEDWYECSIPH